jgi:flavodoxin I
MKTLIIYDSLYGNTEQIAKAIGGGIGGEVKVVRVGEANPAEMGAYDLIIIGSPTQGGRHTVAMRGFLGKIPADALKNKRVASFDTRAKTFFVKMFGWAANRIAEALKEKGGNLVAPGEGFFVKATKGPLVEGELERAAAWAKGIAESKK